MSRTRPFDVTKCARPNILALRPYTSPRDEYHDYSNVTLLDANENAFGPSIAEGTYFESGFTIQSALSPKALQLNRYPDAQQTDLKQMFCNFRNAPQNTSTNLLLPENVCLGVGSDESIDGIIRAFCTPGKDKILICPPAYGMYEVSADVNDVGIVRVSLDTANKFAIRPRAINEVLTIDPLIKVVFVCSPGNPTGTLIPKSDIIQLLDHPTWNGVVVVDEAYIDFAPPGSSLAQAVTEWPNLIVTNTLSKAFGLAAIRLGITYAPTEIARLLNNLKGPYNMSAPTVALARAALQPEGIALMEKKRAMMVIQRDRLLRQLPTIPGFGRFLGGHDTNFLLVQLLDKAGDGGLPDNTAARKVSDMLFTKERVLVRYRGNEPGCVGGLRITVGTEEQMDNLLFLLRKTLEDVFAGEAEG